MAGHVSIMASRAALMAAGVPRRPDPAMLTTANLSA